MYDRSILSLPFLMTSLMLLSSGVMKVSPLPSKRESTPFSMSTNAPCGPNSKFGYGTVCPQSCDNLYYIGHALCIALAVEGCVCDDGYVLESDSSKYCVPVETCGISCADNMHYETGASGCVANCLSPIIPDECDSTWTYDGCVCDGGYIFSFQYPHSSSNICVRPSECQG